VSNGYACSPGRSASLAAFHPEDVMGPTPGPLFRISYSSFTPTAKTSKTSSRKKPIGRRSKFLLLGLPPSCPVVSSLHRIVFLTSFSVFPFRFHVLYLFSSPLDQPLCDYMFPTIFCGRRVPCVVIFMLSFSAALSLSCSLSCFLGTSSPRSSTLRFPLSAVNVHTS